MQPWIHDDSMSNLALANLSQTTVELSPQWERRPSRGAAAGSPEPSFWGCLKFICCVSMTGSGGTLKPMMLPIGKLHR